MSEENLDENKWNLKKKMESDLKKIPREIKFPRNKIPRKIKFVYGLSRCTETK
jgi:hypothetical protein